MLLPIVLVGFVKPLEQHSSFLYQECQNLNFSAEYSLHRALHFIKVLLMYSFFTSGAVGI